MVHAVEECGSRIFSEAKMDRTRRGMGTTATVAGLVDKVLFCAEVGDSRAYVLRNGELAQVTKDQSLVNQLIEAGQLTPEEAENFEHSNIILQALGTTEEVVVDLTFVELRQGDRVMLCSDGLSGLVHEESIRQTLASVHDLPACCARLIELANHGGGHDNITVIVADFSGDGLAAPTDGARPGYYQYPLPLADDETPAYGASQRELELKSEPPRPVGDVMDRRPPPLEEPAPEPEKKSINGVLIAASLALVFGVLGALWALSGDSVDEPQEPSGVRVLIPPRSVEEPPVVEEVRDLDELQPQEFVGEPEIVEPEEVTAPEEPEAVADDEQLVAEPIQIGEPDEVPVETLEVDAEDLEEAPTPVGVALPEMEQRSPRPLGGRASSASNRGSSMGTMAGMRGGSSATEMSSTPNTASMSAETSMTAPAASMALPDNPFL